MRTDFSVWAEKISESVAAHQMATFGKLVSFEESEIERQEESIRRYDGLPIEEVAKMQNERHEQWLKEMTERYGPDFIKYDDDYDDEDDFEWPREGVINN